MESIRLATQNDVGAIKEILNSSELFPSEYLDEMMADYLTNPESEEIWYVKEKNNTPMGFGYCVPEKLTEGTYNLLAIAVRKEMQGSGAGSEMIAYIENLLKSRGHRILIVDTSSGADFELTRKFYLKLKYTKEAVIRDFWAEGEDKVVFWKRLK